MPKGKVVASNRKARHDYEILETYEAGIALTGSEIKSVRAGRVSLKEGYVLPRNGELWLHEVHIAPYSQAGAFGHDPKRPRRLLLHRKEIDRIISRVQEKGLTLVPLSMYLSHGLAKVELALVRGKKKYDKRQALRKKESQRQIERALRRRGR